MKKWIFSLSFLLAACDLFQSTSYYHSQLQKRGYITLLTRNALSSYYLDKNEQKTGFEYELAHAFAKDMGVELRVEVRYSTKELFSSLEKKEGDFVGSGLVSTEERLKNFRSGPKYYEVQQFVTCNRSGKKAKNRLDLDKVKFIVARGTSYEENLEFLKQAVQGLHWKSAAINSEEALQKVVLREEDCTVVDSNILALQQRAFPQLQAMFPISPKQNLQWYFAKSNVPMQKLYAKWFLEFEKRGGLSELVEKYYGFLGDEFDYYDTKVFLERYKERFPQYKDMFVREARKYGLDWKLLAAISYQESHWDPLAKSPTGVRGLMQLTEATADFLGIEDRMDPEQSISAGARYIRKLHSKLKKDFQEPDLMWVTLAAYNVGIGHIYDVMELCKQDGRDPKKWVNIKDYLPKLTEQEVIPKLKYGYANGWEPVYYVQNVRNFYRLLKK